MEKFEILNLLQDNCTLLIELKQNESLSAEIISRIGQRYEANYKAVASLYPKEFDVIQKRPCDIVTPGRIVEFFPGNSGFELPNGMESAPAIVTQKFGSTVNLVLFVAEPSRTEKSVTPTAWSVCHKDEAMNGSFYWDWFKKV